MSRSTRLRRSRAACGCASGSKALGLATIPASSADSQGASTAAHLGRAMPGELSPQPAAVWDPPEEPEPVPALVPELVWAVAAEPYPCLSPKYTRAADSTPYAPLPK